MADIWLITGIPGAGKTTVAELLAREFARGVHIEAEQLQEWIVRGGVWPGEAPEEENRRQLDLVSRNACLLAKSYGDSGFDVALDHVVATRRRVDEYQHGLASHAFHLIVLAPGPDVAMERDAHREKGQERLARGEISIARQWAHLGPVMATELTGVGLWLDNSGERPEDTVAAILDRRGEALVQSLAG